MQCEVRMLNLAVASFPLPFQLLSVVPPVSLAPPTLLVYRREMALESVE